MKVNHPNTLTIKYSIKNGTILLREQGIFQMEQGIFQMEIILEDNFMMSMKHEISGNLLNAKYKIPLFNKPANSYNLNKS